LESEPKPTKWAVGRRQGASDNRAGARPPCDAAALPNRLVIEFDLLDSQESGQFRLVGLHLGDERLRRKGDSNQHRLSMIYEHQKGGQDQLVEEGGACTDRGDGAPSLPVRLGLL
jgi:hypothetical protein